LPNREWFEEVNPVEAKINPVKFAESGYQARQYLKRCLIATIDRNQSEEDLEKALQNIKISVPGFKGAPYISKSGYSASIYLKNENNEEVCIGELIDLF
jgi:hypothetical protein